LLTIELGHRLGLYSVRAHGVSATPRRVSVMVSSS
jgi:hypothetical protein